MKSLSGTFSADGSSGSMVFRGPIAVHVSGTFGSGTVVVQYEGSTGSWYTIDGTSQTAAADFSIDLPPTILTKVKFLLSGATGPSLFYEARGAD